MLIKENSFKIDNSFSTDYYSNALLLVHINENSKNYHSNSLLFPKKKVLSLKTPVYTINCGNYIKDCQKVTIYDNFS